MNDAYLIIVSSIPALYRAWRDSPNATARRMNALLVNRAMDWCNDYQRQTDRAVDDFAEFRAALSGETA